MPQVTTTEDLFKHELQDMYYAEKALAATLPKLAQEATDQELSRAFTAHQKETKKHVSNLEKVFKQIGERARPEIEFLLGHKIFLELHVKVKPRWRRDARILERLGI